MSDRNESWIDHALEELANADARAVVPPEVEAAVFRAWDTHALAVDVVSPEAIRFRHVWRRAMAWVLVPTAAVAVVAVVSLARRPAPAVQREGSPINAGGPDGLSVVAPVAPAPIRKSTVASPIVRRFAANDRRASRATEYVIVPEPFADPTVLHVLRVRMARTALATLGMPIVDPDAEGLVDVEMLVGDDGVARSIRNATFAGEDTDQGAER